MKCIHCGQEFWTSDSHESHMRTYHPARAGELASQDQGDELVAEVLGCPCCGERRMAMLQWIGEDFEEVRCATCGRVYQP